MVLIILSMLVGVAQEVYTSGVDNARFQTMRSHQSMLRRAIEQYHARTQRYPASLNALTRKYLSRVPDDPLTPFVGNDWLVISPSDDPSQSASWTSASTPPMEGIFDVRSSSGM
jgi:general secretion pathway protein G